MRSFEKQLDPVYDDAVRRALREVPRTQREAIVLFEILGMSIEEIAQIQDGTVSAVKSRLSRGRENFATPTKACRERRNIMTSDSSKRMERGLRDLAEEKIPPAHRVRMTNQVRARIERKENMNRFFGRTALAGGFCVLLFIGLLFIPVSYDLCVGSVVEAEWETERANLEAKLAVLRTELTDLDGVIHSTLKKEMEGKMKMELFFAGKGADEARRVIEQKIAAVMSDEHLAQSLVTREIRRKIGGNFLAWASGGKIVIHAAGLSPEELEEAIVAELKRRGAGNAEAHVEITDDNRAMIDITIDDPSAEMIGDSTLTIEITNE